MAHSLNKVWIHAVWATKYRAPIIYESIEELIFNKISDELRGQGCYVKIVNGMPDHVHCLFVLSRKVAVADVIRHAKAGSAYFINQQQLTNQKFVWQTGYSAFSVTESAIEIVYRYIKNQKLIHERRKRRKKRG